MTSGQGFGIRRGTLANCKDACTPWRSFRHLRPCSSCKLAHSPVRASVLEAGCGAAVGVAVGAGEPRFAARRAPARALVCRPMRTASPRLLGALLALALAALLTGCGKGRGRATQPASAGPIRSVAPVAPEGAVSLATRNT